MRLLKPVSTDSLKMHLGKLLSNERGLPPNVEEVCNFLCERQVGFVLSRNSRAGSCREACFRRKRLGHEGIPLFDELKSLVGKITTAGGHDFFVAIHCRANCAIDEYRVLAALNMEGVFSLLDDLVLKEFFGLEYGTVNPILLELRRASHSVLQMFDKAVITPVARIPGTMMTNAGEHTWAVEFDPVELIQALEAPIVADVAVPEIAVSPHGGTAVNPRSIGIITGNGPDSGMALWHGVNNEIVDILGDRFLGDISLPRVTVLSVPEMGLSMELKARADVTKDALVSAAAALCDAGSDVLALACNTTQIFEEELKALCRERNKIFISMADVVYDRVKQLGIEELAIIGIDTVAELGEWSAFSRLSQLRAERPDAETVRQIHEIGYLVKQKGDIHRGFQQLINLLNTRIRSQTIIIALTEISIILESQAKRNHRQRKTIIDTLGVYAAQIARVSLGLEESHSQNQIS